MEFTKQVKTQGCLLKDSNTYEATNFVGRLSYTLGLPAYTFINNGTHNSTSISRVLYYSLPGLPV